MRSELLSAIEQTLSTEIRGVSPVGGGDINEAYRLDTTTLGAAFAKVNHQAPRSMFETEAAGLDWLREAGAISVPEVLAVGDLGPSGGSTFLILQWLESKRPGPRFVESFGQRLAALHRFGADSFGLPYDNYIGRLPQPNQPLGSFADFFAERRLRAQFDCAGQNGHFTAKAAKNFDRLLAKLPALLGPEEPPSRLHGDLWSGNYLVGPDGEPWLIDPAVYGGHREIDLAMMRLFGGFSERVFAAYAEAFPLAPGAAERVQLFQLYPLLVHVNLFGGSYPRSVERIIEKYVA